MKLLNASLIVVIMLGAAKAKHIRREDVTADDLEAMNTHWKKEEIPHRFQWAGDENKISQDVEKMRALEDAEVMLESLLTTQLNDNVGNINRGIQNAIPEPVSIDAYHEDRGEKCMTRILGECVLKYNWWYKVWIDTVYNAKSFRINSFTTIDVSAMDFNNYEGTLSITASCQMDGAQIDGRVSAGVKNDWAEASAAGEVVSQFNVDGDISATVEARKCEKAGINGIELDLVDLRVDIKDADLYDIDIELNNDLSGVLSDIVENVINLVQGLGLDIGKLIGNAIEDNIAEGLEDALENAIEECYTF